MSDIKINYLVPASTDKQDAVFYYGEGRIAVVSVKTESGWADLSVWVQGETLLKLPYRNEQGEFDFDSDGLNYIRYEDEFAAAGINSDADLTRVTQECGDRGLDIWTHNSWFDVYGPNGEHLDAVQHEYDEAIEQAKAIAEEIAAAGGWEAYWSKG